MKKRTKKLFLSGWFICFGVSGTPRVVDTAQGRKFFGPFFQKRTACLALTFDLHRQIKRRIGCALKSGFEVPMKMTAKLTVRCAITVGLAISVAMPCLPALAQVPFVPKAKRPFSDIFTQDAALDARWTLSEPNPASSVAIGSKGLLLDASGQNGGADLWPSTNYKASLLLQPVSSTFDWTAMASIQFAAVNNYMGAGLVLTTQTTGFSASSVFHRFEYGHNPAQGLDSFTNGTPDPANVPFTADFVTLRVEKTGSTYVYSYLPRGGSWTVISTITDTNPYSYIGLISIRQPYDGLTNVDAKPEFKSFKISKVKKTTP